MSEIKKTCENCRHEMEPEDGVHCRNCIHNSLMHENFEPNVCEWEKHRIIDDVVMYKTSCLNEFEESHVKKYKFCPYCSKKIKIAGD